MSTVSMERISLGAVLAEPFSARTWRAFTFLCASFVLTTAGFAYALAAVSAGVPLATFIIGLPVLALLVVGARILGWANRGIARGLLDSTVGDPEPFKRVDSWPVTAMRGAFDVDGWRSISFQLIAWPLSMASFIISTTVLGTSLGLMTEWMWIRFQPEAPGNLVDTPLKLLLASLVGVVMFFVWPYINRGLATLQRLLVEGLLGPTRSSLRIADLSESRSHSVVDSDAKLSDIERNLHDGAQAQLVAVAMKIGDAKERLAAGEDPATVSALLESAHASSKEAVSELRDIARGIRPPVLESGLATALQSVAARSATPVRLTCVLHDRPAASIESIAYFGISELITNANKHAGASTIDVSLTERGDRLVIEVSDDGCGRVPAVGVSSPGDRTGLAGLTNRVKSVDGSMTIDSPVGGPTVVSIKLPVRGV